MNESQETKIPATGKAQEQEPVKPGEVKNLAESVKALEGVIRVLNNTPGGDEEKIKALEKIVGTSEKV